MRRNMHIWRLVHRMCVIVMFLSCVWLYYCWIFKHYFILFCILSKCSSVAPGHFQLTEMELITMMEGHYYCFMFFNAKKQIEWVIWTTRRNKKKNMFRQNWVQYSGTLLANYKCTPHYIQTYWLENPPGGAKTSHESLRTKVLKIAVQ